MSRLRRVDTVLVGALAVALGSACTTSSAPATSTGDAGFGHTEPIDASATADAGAGAGAGADTSCTGADGPEVLVRVVGDALGPSRVYALAKRGSDGADVALIVDTGSQYTFLSTDGGVDMQPGVGSLVFHCGPAREVPGRPITLHESVDGRAVVGVLGADFFFERLRELDLVAETIRAISDRTPPPGALALPYENVKGFLFVSVSIDDTPLRLGFDTGAPHALWLGAAAQPGDTPESSQDAYGDPITLYLGHATLAVAGEPPRGIPLLRAPSFPSLEDSNKLVGGKIDGLFGLTTMGTRRIRIDARTSTIWLSPSPP